MIDVVTHPLVWLLFLACAIRSDLSGARTWPEVKAVVKARGWHSAFTVACVAGVVILLVLVEVCRIGWAVFQFGGAVLGLLALHLQSVGRRAPLGAA